MKIGIFGGTYNPPHLGHMAAAKAAIETLHLDKLLLIPIASHPTRSCRKIQCPTRTGWP